jgi:dTDP-4-amino-4,6-dideoxygalactose transaminase
VAQAVRFSVPPLTPAAAEAAQRVLGSGWFTTGPECGAFEQELSAYLGQPHVITLTSCTHALELSLRALRLPAGSAVMTPSLTFCGAVAAIVHAGYRPVLVDVDETTLTPNEQNVADTIERVGPVAAMVICDLGGYPVDHVALAGAANLPFQRIVVDAAHGPGGTIGRAEAATAPFATCLSFYATKNLPIGEGGAVATHDPELDEWLRRARLHGMSRDAWRRYLPGGSWRYDVPEVGFKANLTDLQAAMGREQLRELPAWQDRRTELVARYDAAWPTRSRPAPCASRRGRPATRCICTRYGSGAATRSRPRWPRPGSGPRCTSSRCTSSAPMPSCSGRTSARRCPSPTASRRRCCRCRSIPTSPIPTWTSWPAG